MTTEAKHSDEHKLQARADALAAENAQLRLQVTHQSRQAIEVGCRLADAQAEIARLREALSKILGDKPDKYGYQAAANVMDDSLRALARTALAIQR